MSVPPACIVRVPPLTDVEPATPGEPISPLDHPAGSVDPAEDGPTVNDLHTDVLAGKLFTVSVATVVFPVGNTLVGAQLAPDGVKDVVGAAVVYPALLDCL